MGREFLLALDRRDNFTEIWAVARRADKLAELESQTRAKIRQFSLDLTAPSGISALSEALDAQKPDVAVLVNAGGYGRFGAFASLTVADQLGMIDLNDRALTAVTCAALPYMTAGGEIFNMGSLSSFQPVPGMAVYAASKAYVLSLSRALAVELKPRGIKVMAVCPGWVRTEFFDRARTDDTVTYYNRYYDAPQVVKRALADMKKGRAVSICGFPVRTQVRAVKLAPLSFVMRVWCRQQKFREKGTFAPKK